MWFSFGWVYDKQHKVVSFHYVIVIQLDNPCTFNVFPDIEINSLLILCCLFTICFVCFLMFFLPYVLLRHFSLFPFFPFPDF